MINFNKYIKQLISEDIHPELSAILSSEQSEPAKRYFAFLKKVRQLDSAGINTGLRNISPKRGSSRAVFIPEDNKEILLDGQKVQTPYVHKMAIHGFLDRYRFEGEPLLGELQNRVESGGKFSSEHGVIVRNSDGSFSTNPHGILVPVYDSHPEHHHLEMGYARDMKRSEFPKLTIAPGFPKGISYNDFYKSLMKEYYDANGLDESEYGDGTKTPEQKHEHMLTHPLLRKAIGLISLGMHPADLTNSNMGIWTHPITGQDHPVARDFGSSTDVLKQYSVLRQRSFRSLVQKTRSPEETPEENFGYDTADGHIFMTPVVPSERLGRARPKTPPHLKITLPDVEW